MLKKRSAKEIIRIQREPKPYEQPHIPYKRSAILVKQSSVNWIFEMLKRGQGKVVFQYFLIWFFIIVGVAAVVLLVLKVSGILDWIFMGGG